MKNIKIICWMVVFTGFMYAIIGLKNTSEQEQLEPKTKHQNLIDSLNFKIDSLLLEIDTLQQENEIGDYDILDALIFVESSNNDSAYCKHEDAVGCLQIRQTMVNDVNRILKRQGKSKRYTYIDRWSRDKSIQMFKIYCNYYNLTTAEEIARCWNGGPRGINKPTTVRYWEKVKTKINS
jgi:hypothetical protein